MHRIIIPTINNNDTQALLVEWVKKDGSEVKAGEIIAVLETTKSTYDLQAEHGGLLKITAQPKQHYDFGATIGQLYADAAERDQTAAAAPAPKAAAPADGEMIITKSAEEVIQKHGLTTEQLRSLGKKIIKAGDLEPLLAKAGGTTENVIRPSGQQLAIARTVSASAAVVPKSFLLKKIYCDEALAYLAAYGQKEKVMAGIPDLLVSVLASLPEKFPFFFGALRDDMNFVPSTAGNIGVTFDLGTGLFIPVVKDAAKQSLKEVAKQMMGFRMKAVRKSFRNEELSGGDISLSINMDTDILMVIPIILLPQTCMLSLGAVQNEVTLDDKGAPVVRRHFPLGLAFDHRVINGYDANQFLNAVKVRFEKNPAGDAATTPVSQ